MQFPSDLIELAACSINLILYLYALDIFLSSKKDYLHLLSTTLGLLFIAVTRFGEIFLPNLAVSILGLIFMVFISVFIYEDKLLWRVIAPVLYNIFDIISTMLVFFLLQRILKMDVLRNDVLMNYERILYLLMVYIFQIALLFLARKYRFSNTPSGNLLFPILFFASDFLIVLLSHVILHYLSPKDKMVGILCTAVCIIMFFTTIIVLKMVNEMLLQKQRENEASILRLLLEEQKKQMLLVQADREKLHSLRHDMKHYLLNYQILLENGNVSAVKEDIRQMLESRLIMSDIVYTNNTVANSLILSIKETCHNYKIDFHVRVILPPSFNNIEIFTAILNLLENAIDAEKEIPADDRYINLEIIHTSKNLSIIVQNRIAQSVLQNNIDLKTTKSENKLHGYGLRNVRQIAQNNNGFVDISEQNNIFSIHMFLTISDPLNNL